MSVPQPLLSREQERELYAQLGTEDVVAANCLCRVYYLPLVGWLRQRNHALDDALIEEAAEWAIVSLIKNPRSYDPERLDLFGYLRMSADGDLKNLLRKEKRQQHEPWNVVETAEASGKCYGKDEEPAVLLQQAEEALAADEFFRGCSLGWSDAEKQVLELMRRGEATTENIARVLSIEHLPFAEQQTRGKRMKDRVMKRLQREGQRRA